jgi:NAD(P)-dependent dehydrogenase (short-subunit alcohol dehydrogenase family)
MLNDRVTIITGGVKGLGKAMALALVAAGGRVVVTGSSASPDLAALEADVAATSGAGRLIALAANVTDAADCARVVATALETFGRLDALINNAGRGMRVISENFVANPVKFWEVKPADWALIFDINVNGVFLMTQAVMPHFLAQAQGRVINISTSDQTMVRKGYAPYGPSKAALEAATRCWAQDVVGTGVTVNALLPGGASATGLLPAGAAAGSDGNLLAPELMGPPAVWLVSDASASHNGERYIARLWDPALPVEAAAAAARSANVEKPSIM